MERSKAAQDSTYGQACTQCYKAKCRCVRTANGNDCERCIRLRKACEPSESVRRRNAQTAAAEASDMRISRLEDKMESLLSAMHSFIGARGETGPAVNVIQPMNEHGSAPSNTSHSNSTLVNPTDTNLALSDGLTSAAGSIAIVSSPPNALLLPHQYPLSPNTPSLKQADERLNFFRSRMLPFFPFIDLTPDMTSWYLRHNRPFLLQAIHTVTTFSTQARLAQIEELKRVLFTSALLEVKSNIDLLLGLLTYLAWSTDAFLGRADLLSRLMMLAVSLVYDLRLFKPSSTDVEFMMMITQGRADDNSGSSVNETPYELLERQRAVLACFMLSSNVSSHLGRQDALRWTPQMEKALQLIATNESCASDDLFISQVRLQLIKQRAEDIRRQDEADYLSTGATPLASAPRLFYIKTLRRQLEELRASFRSETPHIDILNTHAQYVEIYINHLAYSINTNSLSLHPPERENEGVVNLGLERLECLWLSVENINSWLKNFYRIPCSKLVGQPFHFWSQMILSITLLKYLSTLKDPEWDCQVVRNTVNLITAIESMLQRIELSSKEPELQCNDHLLKYLSKLLCRSRMWAQAQWHITSQVQDTETRMSQSVNPDTNSYDYHVPDLDQMTWMQSMDLGNEQWFEDVLGMPATLY